MALKTSTVHRRLDSKLMLFGLEAFDLIFILILASVMNLFFGQTALSALMVFVLPISLGLVLYFTKRKKPEHYLLHLIKFHLLPGGLSCGEDGDDELLRRIYFYE